MPKLRGPCDMSSDNMFNISLPPVERHVRAPIHSHQSIERSGQYVYPALPSSNRSVLMVAEINPAERTLPDASMQTPLDIWRDIMNQPNLENDAPTNAQPQVDAAGNSCSPLPPYSWDVNGIPTNVRPQIDHGVGPVDMNIPTPLSPPNHPKNVENSLANAQPQIEDRARISTPSSPRFSHSGNVNGALANAQLQVHDITDVAGSGIEDVRSTSFYPRCLDDTMTEAGSRIDDGTTTSTAGISAPSCAPSYPAFLDPLEAYNWTPRVSSLPNSPSFSNMIPFKEEDVQEPMVPLMAESPMEPKFDQQVPSKIPPEVEAVCDSYAAGTPVVVVASRSFLARRWSLSILEECGVAYLGFFKITSVQVSSILCSVLVNTDCSLQEQRLAPSESPQIPDADCVYGGAEWRFTCKWIPDGEDAAQSEASGRPPQPWWALNSSPDSSPAPTDSEPSLMPPVEDFTQTSPRYQVRRMKHPNYYLRQIPLYKRFYRLLPDFLLAPAADGVTEVNIPTGWFCPQCGRVNFQEHLRHRMCRSSFCKVRPSAFIS